MDRSYVGGRGWMLAVALVGCGDAGTGAGGSGTIGSSSGTTGGSQTPTTGVVSSEPTGDVSATGTASMTGGSDSDTPTSGPGEPGGSSTGPVVTGGDGTSTGGESTTGTGGSASSSGTGVDSGDSSSTSGSSSGGESSSTGAVSAGSSSTGEPGCASPADCPVPPAECVAASCAAGVCGEAPEPVGVACSLGECDGQGGCVECLVDGDCESGVCEAGACADASCSDGVSNGGESDVDCGGPCDGCEVGEGCDGPGDCASGVCQAGLCAPAGPLCAGMPADPVTGQRCPLFMSCTQSAECGELVGCQQWFCNNAKTCELNAKVDCWTNKGGGCNADVVFTQQTLPPVDKRFVPPDNVNFREVASLAFTIKNNTASDLHLDKLPLQLEVMGGGSKFDVTSVKIFDNSGGTEHGPGDLLVCLTGDPFSFPANGVMGPCGGSAFSKVLKGQSNQFVVNVAFAKEKTFIAGRSYRLVMASTAGIEFKVGLNGPVFAGSTCGVPNGGYVGAWVTAQKP